jgi:hypothetical protein
LRQRYHIATGPKSPYFKRQRVRIAGVSFAMRIVAKIIALAVLFGTGTARAQDEVQTDPGALAAKHDIEREGYRDVRGLAEDSNGVWHGRALAGHTEVQLLVDPEGNVSLNRGQ